MDTLGILPLTRWVYITASLNISYLIKENTS